jgi:hypothetical protein
MTKLIDHGLKQGVKKKITPSHIFLGVRQLTIHGGVPLFTVRLHLLKIKIKIKIKIVLIVSRTFVGVPFFAVLSLHPSLTQAWLVLISCKLKWTCYLLKLMWTFVLLK